MGIPVTFGVKHLYFKWLADNVAETGRITLPPGVRRRGKGQANSVGDFPHRSRRNDQLVPHIVATRGHFVLRLAWGRLDATTNNTSQENLELLSELLEYSRYDRVALTPAKRQDRPRLKPAIQAITWVFTESPQQKLAEYEIKAFCYGHMVKQQSDRGCYRGYSAGMFGGRCLLISRKMFETSLDPLRNLPDFLKIVEVQGGHKLRVEDRRSLREKAIGLDIRVLTRLHADREELLDHAFPKLLLGYLKEALRDDDPIADDSIITSRAFEQINNMFGYHLLTGHYNMWCQYRDDDRSDGSGGNCFFEPMVAQAFMEAYIEYFGDEVDEESWTNYVYEFSDEERARKSAGIWAAQSARQQTARELAVEQSAHFMEEQARRFGHGVILPIVSIDRNNFCETVLQGRGFACDNIRVYGEPWVRLRGVDRLLSPWEACEQFHGPRIEVYDGITGAADRTQRPLVYVADKYYGRSKARAMADGWQVGFVYDCVDREFNVRRMNAGYGEHYMQRYMEDDPKFHTGWDNTEPIPVYGENRANINPDSGYIGFYLCIRFVYDDMEECV
jgi:hypothetical protein